jgi:Protein of unknown function DUF262
MNNNLQINTRVRRLFQYLQDFEKGNIQIPVFQRDFIWTLKQKTDLLDSIRRGYPIGSILFWRPDEKYQMNLSEESLQTVGCYQLPKRNIDFFYILDGYQRLSTLFGCLINPEKTALIRNEAAWKAQFSIIYDLENDTFLQKKDQSKLEVYEIPIYKFIDGSAFYEFSTQLLRSNVDKATVDKYLATYGEFGAKISSYDIPSIDLIGGDIRQAVAIFSRLNTRGSLVTDDWLVSALSYNEKENFRLGTEIDILFDKLAVFNFFKGKGDRQSKRNLIFQCIINAFDGFYVDSSSQAKLENLAKRPDFIGKARMTLSSIQKTVAFLYEKLNVIDSKFLPYNNQLIFITDFFNNIESPNEHQLSVLENWFWVTTYANYFTIYNLSEQRLAYQQFQAFLKDEQINPIFFYKGKVDFVSTSSFPQKVDLGSVRSKALLLFMIYYQLNGNDLKSKHHTTYKFDKLFSDLGKNELGEKVQVNRSENRVVTIEPTTDDFKRDKSNQDLSHYLASDQDHTAFFITQEMKDLYKANPLKARLEILEMRKSLIIAAEMSFIGAIGLGCLDDTASV